MQQTPKYARVKDWCAMTGMSRTSTWRKITSGELKAARDRRTVLIDVEHGLNWLSSLTTADHRIAA